MGELQNTLALLIGALAKSIHRTSSSKLACSNFPYPKQERFEYGALGELVIGVATRSQMSTPLKMPTAMRD